MDKEKEPSITPPYISRTKLEKTFELIANRNINELSPNFFFEREFGKADSFLAFNALKFLKIIDENGKATEFMPQIKLRGDARTKAFEKIVRNAYHKIFDVIESPQNLSKDELANELMAQYDISPRVVNNALPAFNQLLVYAGLKDENTLAKRSSNSGSLKPKKIVAPKTKEPSVPAAKDNGRDFDFHIPIVEDKMYIEVPESVYQKSFLDDTLHEDLRALVKKAREFANKHIPKDNTEKGTEDSG